MPKHIESFSKVRYFDHQHQTKNGIVRYHFFVYLFYHYETKRINEVVKRNIQRFLEDFCFKLTNEKYNILKSQIATSNVKENIHIRGGKQKIPYVFTEKGIIMLSGLLKYSSKI